MNHSTDHNRQFRDLAVKAIKALAAVAVTALFANMSWNMFAPELFGLPEMRAKHALGLVVFAGIAGVLLTRPRQHAGSRHGHG